MHAFDLTKIDGGITVRFATENEALTLLDGAEVKLKSDTLVIADDNIIKLADALQHRVQFH